MENSNSKKFIKNNILKYCSTIFAWSLFLILFLIIIFILIKSVPSIQHYGIDNILFTNKFDLTSNNKQVSVWLPLAITFIVSFFAILIATPLAIKTASFIKFRIKSAKLQKWLIIIIETSSGIPSVIFGLFASQSLGLIIKEVFGLSTTYTILTAIFMLSFMIIPTILSLTINAFNNVDKTLIPTSVSLGLTKTKSIYKIFRKETKGAIVVAIILALGRAIGETMAISMILNSQDYSTVINNGFIAILTSNLSPLGSVISVGMFAENGGENLRSLLYFFGIILFVIVMILNGFVMFLSSHKKTAKYPKLELFRKKVYNFFAIVPNSFSLLFDKIFRFKNYNQKTKIYSYYKIGWEIICSIIVFSFIAWICLDVLINGFISTSTEYNTIFAYTKDTTGQATINTLLVILITTLITLPISLLIALYLSEYSKNKKIRQVVLFFIDSLGATPSIIFGMFGLAFFIQTLGISMSGTIGQSLLAGCLTIGLVVLPNLIRNIYQSLVNVPNILKENGYALGCLKIEVIFKIILPTALRSIISSVILSISRILSETAPLYLTAGLSSANTIAILNPGQTLTTRIYAQLSSSNNIEAINVMYNAALSTFLLVLFLTCIGHIFIPYYTIFKQEIIDRINIYKICKKTKLKTNINFYKKQIVKNVLYLSESQAEFLNIDENLKFILFRFKKIKVKILNDNELNTQIGIIYAR